MTDITIDFEYPVPDEQYAQTDSKNKKGKLRYIGPDKVYIWVDNITNKLSQWESGGTGEELWNGDIPMPTGTGQFLIELDVQKTSKTISMEATIYYVGRQTW